jgi:histone deacetylase 6
MLCPSLIAVQIDFSKELVAWVRKEGYALLDTNLYPKPSTTVQLVSGLPALYTCSDKFQRHKSFEDVGRDIMTYLWDNYIQ